LADFARELFAARLPDAKCDPDFLACRDHQTKRETRDRLQDAWERLALATANPSHFADQFPRDFIARAWELYLLAVTDAAGCRLLSPPGNGPDVYAEHPSGLRFWIEAVTVRPGDELTRRGVTRDAHLPAKLYTIDDLILRCASGIRSKLRALVKYRRAGIVKADEPVIVALSHGAIPHSDMEGGDVPVVVKSVLPVGEPVIVITPYSDAEPERTRTTRERVLKASGRGVRTDLFLRCRSFPIAGVAFTAHHIWNLQWRAEKSLRVLENPRAQAPLPRGALPARCTYWVEDEHLRWSPGPEGMVGTFS
jgi:hypothetical protein